MTAQEFEEILLDQTRRLTPAEAALILDALNLAIRRKPAILDGFDAAHLALVIRFATPDVQAAAQQRLDKLTAPYVH